MAAFAIDISHVKQGEAALAESEARLRSLLEVAPVGIWQLDAEGRTVFANGQLARLSAAWRRPRSPHRASS